MGKHIDRIISRWEAPGLTLVARAELPRVNNSSHVLLEDSRAPRGWGHFAPLHIPFQQTQFDHWRRGEHKRLKIEEGTPQLQALFAYHKGSHFQGTLGSCHEKSWKRRRSSLHELSGKARGVGRAGSWQLQMAQLTRGKRESKLREATVPAPASFPWDSASYIWFLFYLLNTLSHLRRVFSHDLEIRRH